MNPVRDLTSFLYVYYLMLINKNWTIKKEENVYTVMLISLYRLDAVLCYNHLPRIFSSLMSYYLSDHSTLSKAAQETMNVSLLEHF